VEGDPDSPISRGRLCPKGSSTLSLRRVGRFASLLGAVVSVVALVHDLGRPARFLHMLRVFKPTSPLSVGSWILSPFGTLSGIAAASELTGIAPGIGRAAGVGAGIVGPAMTTYTAVLLADTAVPAWHEGYRDLPFVFAGSAMAAGGGMGLLAGGDVRPARSVAVAGAVLELGATAVLERRIGFARTAYTTGRPGSAATRFGVFDAGSRRSPRDVHGRESSDHHTHLVPISLRVGRRRAAPRRAGRAAGRPVRRSPVRRCGRS